MCRALQAAGCIEVAPDDASSFTCVLCGAGRSKATWCTDDHFRSDRHRANQLEWFQSEGVRDSDLALLWQEFAGEEIMC